MKNKILENFFTSGHQFTKNEIDERSSVQMMNIGIVTSSIAYLFGFVLNQFNMLAWCEFVLLLLNIVFFLLLRKDKKYYSLAARGVTIEGTFLLILLFYISEPSQMKFVWIYTYPIVMLYLNSDKEAVAWVLFLIFMVLIVPFQPFFTVQYSFFQVFYIVFALAIISIIVFFYKKKMMETRSLILTQQKQLAEQFKEVKEKDRILSIQSKQAVMGEMISMIAHQWRQPLSTVTLNISNIQVKRLLGEELEITEIDKALDEINRTVVYLSDTIDDFQTYFHPNKEIVTVEIYELIQKAINFTKPRLKNTKIEIECIVRNKILLQTYTNEMIQVLLNILNNAIDELISREIKSPKIVIRVKNLEDELLLEIEDNAGGIDAEHIDFIFEPYFSTKGKNGTGLGLYMSQMIIQKQFHSSIEVQSQNNKTLFCIRVPKKLA